MHSKNLITGVGTDSLSLLSDEAGESIDLLQTGMSTAQMSICQGGTCVETLPSGSPSRLPVPQPWWENMALTWQLAGALTAGF